ncbi:hypothetical protein ACIQFZ_22380 [Streptomyces sp. NPDC093064]|uniref:hypothetical protein n=1 Tax=unclassified Streptomyces TaxID=2593676 RepID=UPI0036AAB108
MLRVLALQVDSQEWNCYEMTATEFLYRALTEAGFWSYSVAQAVPEPFFEPA